MDLNQRKLIVNYMTRNHGAIRYYLQKHFFICRYNCKGYADRLIFIAKQLVRSNFKSIYGEQENTTKLFYIYFVMGAIQYAVEKVNEIQKSNYKQLVSYYEHEKEAEKVLQNHFNSIMNNIQSHGIQLNDPYIQY